MDQIFQIWSNLESKITVTSNSAQVVPNPNPWSELPQGLGTPIVGSLKAVDDDVAQGDRTFTLGLTFTGEGLSAVVNTIEVTVVDNDLPQPVPPTPAPTIDLAQGDGQGIPDGQIETVDFAPEGPGATRTFPIFNRSSTPLELLEVLLPPGFVLVGLSRQTVPGGQAALLEIAFQGTDPGKYTGNVIVKTNIPGQPFYNFPVAAILPPPQATTPTLETFLANLASPEPRLAAGVGEAIAGGAGSQFLQGQAGDDALNGNQDHDVLDGGAGNDTLNGGQGDDALWGGAGNDWLAGDFGNDSLIGGAGADVFVLGRDRGVDTIFDFEDGIDAIALEPDLTFDQLTLTEANGHTQLFVGSTLVATILNTPASALTLADVVNL